MAAVLLAMGSVTVKAMLRWVVSGVSEVLLNFTVASAPLPGCASVGGIARRSPSSVNDIATMLLTAPCMSGGVGKRQWLIAGLGVGDGHRNPVRVPGVIQI